MCYIKERLFEINKDAVILVGFDKALVGIDIEYRAVYSTERIINKLIEDGFELLEAIKYYTDVIESFLSNNSPIDLNPVVINDFDYNFNNREKGVYIGKVTL